MDAYKRLKILLVTFSLPHADAHSGASIVMHGQLEALRERHDVTLVIYPVIEDAERAALDDLRRRGVRVHAIGERVPPWIIRWKRKLQHVLARTTGEHSQGPAAVDRRLPRLLRRLIAAGQFDILQVEDIGISVDGLRVPRTVPTLLVEHEVRGSLPGDPRSGTYQPDLWKQFDRVQVFSERDAAAVRAADPSLSARVRVNPFGIHTPAAAPDPGGCDVLFVGDFTHLPNVDAAVWLAGDILPLVRARGVSMRVLLVGNAPPPAVRALAGDDVVVTGRVPDVAPYLRSAAVVAAPVRSGGGMRVKVMQALAWGKPTVTTTIGVEGLFCDSHAPPLLIADDAPSFAATLADLLQSPGQRAKLGCEARAFVSDHLSWARYRERLEAIYGELLRTPA